MSDTTTLPSADLIAKLVGLTGLNAAACKSVLKALALTSRDALVAGQAVKLPDLGTLTPKATAPRSGAALGQTWSRPASRRVSFKAAAKLKRAVALLPPED